MSSERSNTRWTKQEKSKLIELYAKGQTIDQIADELNRSVSAIKLRIEAIVYEGIAKGMTVHDLEKILNTDDQTIKQMFYAHHSFKQGRGEEVVPLDTIDKMVKSKGEKLTAKKAKEELINKNEARRTTTEPVIIRTSDRTVAKPRQIVKSTGVFARKVEQNKVMETIIDNRDLRKKIKKLYKSGKLTKEEKKLLEDVLIP